MRLVYLYVSDGPAYVGANLPWDKDATATNPFVQNTGILTEGFCYLFDRLLSHKIVDEVLIVVESTRGEGSCQLNGSGMSAYVMPEIAKLEKFLRPDDVIFCRHGFRTWFPFLQEMQKQRRWIMFYRAAGNRGPWPFWDIVLEDCLAPSFVDEREMFHFHFAKPTNPTVFYHMGLDRPIDVCIGASHIHDKKAQWKAVQVLAELQRKYKRKLRCVMPGRMTGGPMTRKMFYGLDFRELDIDCPGMVDRSTLATIMNQCKLFIHLGGAGQNDRGVLEAMSCGCQPILANIKYHAPFTYSNRRLTYVVNDSENIGLTAAEVRNVHDWWEQSVPWKIAEYYGENADVETRIVPEFKKLFEVIGSTQRSDRRLLKSAYGL